MRLLFLISYSLAPKIKSYLKYFSDKNSQKQSLWCSQLSLKIDFLEAFSMLSQLNSVLWWIAIQQGVELRQMLPWFLRHKKILQIWSCPTVIIKMTFRDTATIWREIIHSIGQAHNMFSPIYEFFLPNIWFFHPIFRFWFLVTFGKKVTKILRNLCLHFARQDGQNGRKPERKSSN